MIRVTAFRWVPPFVQGLVRDLRVRWALEESGLAYEQRLIGREDQTSEAYRRLQPFGQVPVYEEEGLALFESGAIVMHIAERSEVLMPRDPAARARARAWMFAALNSMEPALANLSELDLLHANEPWAPLRRPALETRVDGRLAALATWLGDKDYLEGYFTAGDLLMTTVLRLLRHTDLLARHPALDAYRARCEARPAFGRALSAQLGVYAQNTPPGMTAQP